jgi:glycosyltransferase involved in cell wall biosynthesis
MRILSVATAPPYPPTTAVARRTWHLLTHVARDAEVTVLTWADSSVPRAHLDAVRAAVHRLVVLERRPVSMGPAARLAREGRAQLGGLPPYVQALRAEREPAPAMPQEFDLMIAEDEPAAFMLPRVRGRRVVHRLSVMSSTIGELGRCDSFGAARSLKWQLDVSYWRRFDRRLTAAADLSVAVTEEVASKLRELDPGAPIAFVPQHVEVPARQVTPSGRPSAVFLGMMNYHPNIDAVVWFTRSVWPQVRRRFPAAELRVVGRYPDPVVLGCAGDGVRVTGEVPDIVDACDGAWVGIAPLRAGWGLKTKTIELAAMGLPMVSTTRGGEGLTASSVEGLWIADEPDAFADRICELFSSRERAAASGRAARAFVASRLPLGEPPRRYLELLRSLVGEGVRV